MKKPALNYLILIAAGVFIVNSSIAQTTPRPKPVAIPIHNPPSWDSRINITDFNGRLFKNIYADIEGSAYFLDSFCYANVTTTQGTAYENIQVKIDLHSNDILIITKEGKEMIPQGGLIKNILLIDSSKKEPETYFFKSGYPAIEQNTELTFYEVLSDGAIQLLKYNKKDISEIKNEMSGDTRKEFVLHENYFVYTNGEIKKMKREKDFILELMQDKKDKINEYLKINKLNFKNTESITKLFEYYNSLKKPF
jgi:hypothetical protein